MGAEADKWAGIILAAGEGTRMGPGAPPKAAMEIAGRPAVVHVLDRLAEVPVDVAVVVVGYRAEDVMACIGECPPVPVMYAYQAVRRGTGHAARCGLEPLLAAGFGGRVIIAMADKLMAPGVLRRLAEAGQSADAAVCCSRPDPRQPELGMVVLDEAGGFAGIIEVADFAAAAAARRLGELLEGDGPVEPDNVRRALEECMPPSGKVPRPVRPIVEMLEAGAFSPARLKAAVLNLPRTIRVAGTQRSPEWVKAHWMLSNQGLYAAGARQLDRYLRSLAASNAQAEAYLPDAINAIVADGGRVAIVEVDLQEIAGFNTPEELETARAAVQGWQRRTNRGNHGHAG